MWGSFLQSLPEAGLGAFRASQLHGLLTFFLTAAEYDLF